MITIGIDMSKNSPGVCVREGDSITFLSFIRGEENKKNRDHYNTLRERGVTIITNPRSTKIKEYSELEIWKLDDAALLAETIVSNLPDANMVGMEGFSYGSKGNSGLDIAGYAYCVRRELLKKYGTEKLCIFSPAQVKKLAGKGNAGKEDIMKFFLERQDEALNENLMWKGLKNGEITTAKPVDDLVDAYYIQECALIYRKTKNKDLQ